MSNLSATVRQSNQPRVVFLGMRCAFSIYPLQSLIAAGIQVVAALVPGLRDTRPARSSLGVRLVAQEPTLDSVAHDAKIPLGCLRGVRHAEARELIAEVAPDVIAVSCFPWLLPRDILDLPPLGCINVHPSLLPRWRGPEPLFWTFRAGDATTGVTVHQMDNSFDTGAILAQQSLTIPSGIPGDALERQLAQLGGELLAGVIRDVAAGSVEPRPQGQTGVTIAPSPSDADLLTHTNQPALKLFNYVRGVTPLWGAIPVAVAPDQPTLLVVEALDVDPDGVLDAPVSQVGDICLIRCQPGVVTVRVTSSGALGV